MQQNGKSWPALLSQLQTKRTVLVTEYCEGGSLHSMLEQAPYQYGLPEKEFMLVLFHTGQWLVWKSWRFIFYCVIFAGWGRRRSYASSSVEVGLGLLNVCVCVCVCARVHARLACMHMCMHVCKSVIVCVCVCVCLSFCVYICVYICVCLCMCLLCVHARARKQMCKRKRDYVPLSVFIWLSCHMSVFRVIPPVLLLM